MADSAPTTSRPRPPALARRSTSGVSKASPPPSYASSFSRSMPSDTLLGSPVRATIQMMGWDERAVAAMANASSPIREEDFDWLNEKSRSELSQLLMKAESLIKRRETDLDHSSSICKSLYEENSALKAKHETLIARLPPSLLSTPIPSPISSPFGHTPSSSVADASTTRYSARQNRRVRRVSISPSDLSLLADQNAELMAKLQQLESESGDADVAARKKLRNLEKEIALLRDDLESTQAKNAELEEKASVTTSAEDIADAVLRKKEEIQALKESLMACSSPEKAETGEKLDFAPSGPFPPAQMLTPPRRALQQQARSISFDSPAPRTPSPPSRRTHIKAMSVGEPKLAVVSQLLQKIQELEDTNAQIIEQQNEHSTKIRDFQRETESMSKMYEVLADAEGELCLEISDESFVDSPDQLDMLKNGTIRFRSFKRTLDNSVAQEELGMQRTSSQPGKARKSVMGLFGPQAEEETSQSIPFPNSYDASSPASPALSQLSFSMSRADDEDLDARNRSPMLSYGSVGNSLQSELGADWAMMQQAAMGNYHHLRTTSLFGISDLSAPPSPSPVVGPFLSRMASPISPPRQNQSLTSGALQLTLEPPTPPQPQPQPSTGSASKQTMRYRKMSHTVRGRSGNWAESRFRDTLRSPIISQPSPFEPGSPEKEIEEPPTLVQTLDSVVQRVMGKTAVDIKSEQEIRTEEKEREDAEKAKEREKTSILLELWLWLQFIVIILVFLYAVAKRGPKAVLSGQNPGGARVGRRATQ